MSDRTFLRTHAAGLASMALGVFVFLAPMAVVFAREPGDFNARTAGVLVTNPENLQHELDGYHVSTLAEVLAIQTEHTFEGFNIRGETSLQYGHPTPLLDPWTGGLVAMGALAVLLGFGGPAGVLLTIWVWLTLVAGSILTIDAPFSPRVLPVLPALAVGAALTLDRAWSGVTRLAGRAGTLGFVVPTLVVLGLALRANVHDYFDEQVAVRQPAGRFTLLANSARSLQDEYRLFAIGNEDWTLSSEAPSFIARGADAVNVRNGPLALPLERVPNGKGAAFFVENSAPDYAQRMTDLHRAYPDGLEQVISQTNGSAVFTVYLVDRAQLMAANPRAIPD